MKRQKRTWRWVAGQLTFVQVFVDARKPTPSLPEGYYVNDGPSRSICRINFNAVFGWAPKPGEVCKATFISEKLEEK